MTMPINLDGEKPDNVSQEQWDRLRNVFDDIYEDESEVDQNARQKPNR